MSNEQIIDSLGRIDDDMIAEAATVRMGKKHKFVPRRWMAAAACLVLILGITMTAEAGTGAVSNLLAPLFGGAQTEIVDSIGIPIDASVTADGYTLTADAIIGDRYNVAIVYTLTREDGEPIPDGPYGVNFTDYTSGLLKFPGGGTYYTVRNEEDPASVYVIETWSSESDLIGETITVRFADLTVFAEEGEDTLLAEGPWELTYRLRYQDSTEKIPVKNLTVTGDGGGEYRIDKLQISPIGIHVDFTWLNPEQDKITWDDYEMIWDDWEEFSVSLQLRDGTVMELSGTQGAKSSIWRKGIECDFETMFDYPIPLEDIAALIIFDTTYPICVQ